MDRILLIGQAPGPNTDAAMPLYPSPTSSAGGRLAALSGLSRLQYLATFDRINLLNEFPGRTRKRDDTWPVRDARIAASAIRPLLFGRRVILVGRNVSDAFGLDPAEPFHEWMSKNGIQYAVIPHPSGRNHWYRKPENLERATAFWAVVRENPNT